MSANARPQPTPFRPATKYKRNVWPPPYSLPVLSAAPRLAQKYAWQPHWWEGSGRK